MQLQVKAVLREERRLSLPFVVKISDLSSKIGGEAACVKSVNCSYSTLSFQQAANQNQKVGYESEYDYTNRTTFSDRTACAERGIAVGESEEAISLFIPVHSH